MATLIGTPPNLILAGAARELIGVSLDFFTFLKFGLPIAIILLPVCWALLVFVFHRDRLVLGAEGVESLKAQRDALGSMTLGERRVVTIFVCMALAWFFREPKVIGPVTVFGLTTLLPGLTDAGIAIIGGISLFLTPGRDGAGGRRDRFLRGAKRVACRGTCSCCSAAASRSPGRWTRRGSPLASGFG